MGIRVAQRRDGATKTKRRGPLVSSRSSCEKSYKNRRTAGSASRAPTRAEDGLRLSPRRIRKSAEKLGSAEKKNRINKPSRAFLLRHLLLLLLLLSLLLQATILQPERLLIGIYVSHSFGVCFSVFFAIHRMRFSFAVRFHLYIQVFRRKYKHWDTLS